MIIIKFGGSVITDKAKECMFKSDITQQLLGELCNLYDDESKSHRIKDNNNKIYDLILVHGAGSFGHILAKRYELDAGFKNKEQLLGMAQVHHDVRDLNLKFMKALISHGFPSISLPPVNILRNRAKMIAYMDIKLFKSVLDMDLIPVTFGDVVLDERLVFSICSGDSIIRKLSELFHPNKVIFLTDVDGLYTSNPALDKDAKLIRTLTDDSFATACTTQNVNPDVTGGIYLKAKIALELAGLGIECLIINGGVKGRLSAALRGVDVVGTVTKH